MIIIKDFLANNLNSMAVWYQSNNLSSMAPDAKEKSNRKMKGTSNNEWERDILEL